ncbi:TPA: protein disulfide oxidoreductase [Raoultella planticola]|jgi:thiol-disulfide isomerase/thioredoxin|uniref:Protein disulfide oxidoreductase n=1 Tax=Raoultella planticola TaxID=575 RepID=A0A443VL27_RAOPL|nr:MULTISPECIES: protein disulfide oxidoreductase [Raoultella]AUU03050.1 protein disulfide oxidoreductase [Raoultella planticola]EIY2675481.1 protein disulfide oxidoreductase [Raoultella planticola]EKW5589115.1 protein disulfide oxidoreductase [Raoultella planticola]EMD1842234.1 protein disulfide oxidoreductase [Raoultella planticola]KAJ92979.1 alkyl hydroperoxide reductase [Raoultella planticola]
MASKLRRWLRELIILLLLAGALIAGMDYLRRPALPPNLTTTPLQTLEGNVVDLHAMSQQRPLLIYVWATWCGVCRYTTPSVAALASNGGNVMTVALRSGDDATLSNWLAHKKMALPTVNDPDGGLSRQWGVQVTPTLIVISRGEVKSVTTGWTSGWGMRLRLWLAS